MFKIIVAAALSAMTYQAQAEVYGEEFVMPRGGEYTVSQVFEEMKEKKKLKDIVVGGELASVCQMKGCWVTLRTKGDLKKTSSCDETALSSKAQQEMRVMFKGHSFSVPKDLTGDVLVKGTVEKKKLSKYQVKHFLKDLGCPQEQIEAIKNPIYKYQMKATGLKTPGKKVSKI
jgi:hypothetical protein